MAEAALAARSPAAAAAPLLAVRGLEAWYGESHVLHGIDFDVAPGEVVTLLGRNGAGKTTTLKSIIGIMGKRRGSIVFDGVETIRLPLADDRPARRSATCRRSAASSRASPSRRTSTCRRG